MSRTRVGSLFTALASTNVAALLTGMVVYGEPFRFWEFAYSYLGGTVTANGHPNVPARLVFGLGMVTSGFIMFAVAANFHLDSRASRRRLKTWLCIGAGLGYFVIIYPYDIHNTIHSTGSALVFGGLWALATLLLVEGRSMRTRPRTLLCQLALQCTVCSYAVTWALGTEVKHVVQKPAVFALVVIVRIASSVPREVLETEAELAADEA